MKPKVEKDGVPETAEQIIKTTFRFKKSLVRRMKQYGLDSEKSLNEIGEEALDEYLKKREH